MRFLPVAVLLLLLHCKATGKEYPMSHYTMEHGLPSNVVYDIWQDKKGFIWLATDKGVARYNGIKFETYTTYNGLADNEIFSIREDQAGRLWMGTYNGKLCYYKEDKFYSEKNTPFLKLPFKPSMTYSITSEPDSSITIYFDKRSAIVNIRGSHTSIYYLDKINNRYRGKNICAIKWKNRSTYEIIYPGSTIVIDTAMNILSEKENRWQHIFYIQKGRKGHYVEKDSIYTEDFKPVGVSLKAKNGRLTYHVYSDAENYFISANSGLFINGNNEILSSIPVACVNSDKDGNYWIGTLGDGLYLLNRSFKTTEFYKNVYRGAARYAYADSNGLFIGVQNKSLYRLSDGKSACIFNASGRINFRSATLRNAYIIDGTDYYAFGNDDNFIVKNINSTQPSKHNFFIHNEEYANDIFATGSHLYFVIRNNIFYVKKQALGRRTYIAPRILPPGKEEYLYARAQAGNGDVWYTTIDSVFRIAGNKPISQPQFGNTSFRAFGIWGNYLVGYTHDNRLLVCHNFENNISIRPVTGENCIWDKFYKLNDSNALISTNDRYRLMTLHASKDTAQFSIYPLENTAVPLNAECIVSDGYDCFFLRDGSVTRISIHNLLKKPAAPSMISATIKTKKNTYSTSGPVYISYNEAKYISLSFAAPSFNGQVFYEYRIDKENDTDSWRQIRGEEINLYNLGYGSHTIVARARTASSGYNTPLSFELIVSPPFWARWLFIVPCIIGAGALVWAGVHLRVKYVLRAKEKAHEAEVKFLRSEYKALNALMNPHFIFNAMNSVQWMIKSDDTLSASEYLHTFSTLIRQNMQHITSELILLQKELLLVENYLKLEKLRFKDYLNFEIQVEDSVDTEDILIPPLLIQPLVENAIRHGLFPKQSRDNLVRINIYEHAHLLHIEITDNGVGISHAASPGATHQSLGITSIKKRIAQLSAMHNTHISFEIAELSTSERDMHGTRAVIIIDTEVFTG